MTKRNIRDRGVGTSDRPAVRQDNGVVDENESARSLSRRTPVPSWRIHPYSVRLREDRLIDWPVAPSKG